MRIEPKKVIVPEPPAVEVEIEEDGKVSVSASTPLRNTRKEFTNEFGQNNSNAERGKPGSPAR
jgi:hypothetical protein